MANWCVRQVGMPQYIAVGRAQMQPAVELCAYRAERQQRVTLHTQSHACAMRSNTARQSLMMGPRPPLFVSLNHCLFAGDCRYQTSLIAGSQPQELATSKHGSPVPRAHTSHRLGPRCRRTHRPESVWGDGLQLFLRYQVGWRHQKPPLESAVEPLDCHWIATGIQG